MTEFVCTDCGRDLRLVTHKIINGARVYLRCAPQKRAERTNVAEGSADK
jgi:hypothetical protein